MLVYQRVLYALRLHFATGTSNNIVSELVAEEFPQEAPIFQWSRLQNPIVFVEDLPSQPIGKNHGAIEFCFNQAILNEHPQAIVIGLWVKSLTPYP